MDSRPILQEVLENIPDVEKVYFDPPESVKMVYTCIRYSLTDIDVKHANDLAYNTKNGYELTLISRNPSEHIVKEILSLPMCSFVTFYKADKLFHYKFKLYY